MLSLEIIADKATKVRYGLGKMLEIRQRLLDKGIYARVTSSIYGDRLHFGPPCIITQAEADKAVDLIYSVLKDIK
jgi:adenosylmethionine-8-amino-7-oxononanoate aminotransferase